MIKQKHLTVPFPTGKYLPLGDKGDRGRRDHRKGQKEDGIGPSGDSAHGHHWPDCPGKQLGKVQVSARKWERKQSQTEVTSYSV